MTILVKVKIKQKETRIERISDPSTTLPVFRVCLKSAPIQGKANAELIALLAHYFSRSQSAFKIKRGLTSTTKLIAF